MSYVYTIPGENTYGFYLALFATLIIGVAGNLGEGVIIGRILNLYV